MMELHDVYSMRMKLEDVLIEIKLWEPQKKELKKEVKGLKGLIKPVLKLIRMFKDWVKNEKNFDEYREHSPHLGFLHGAWLRLFRFFYLLEYRKRSCGTRVCLSELIDFSCSPRCFSNLCTDCLGALVPAYICIWFSVDARHAFLDCKSFDG